MSNVISKPATVFVMTAFCHSNPFCPYLVYNRFSMSLVGRSLRPFDLFSTVFTENVAALALHKHVHVTTILTTIKRRFRRMKRRRKVGRAYDMALEVARVLPPWADVLDRSEEHPSDLQSR